MACKNWFLLFMRRRLKYDMLILLTAWSDGGCWSVSLAGSPERWQTIKCRTSELRNVRIDRISSRATAGPRARTSDCHFPIRRRLLAVGHRFWQIHHRTPSVRITFLEGNPANSSSLITKWAVATCREMTLYNYLVLFVKAPLFGRLQAGLDEPLYVRRSFQIRHWLRVSRIGQQEIKGRSVRIAEYNESRVELCLWHALAFF